MKALLSKLILRRVTICVLVVILLACGVLATMDMSTNLLPSINMPMLGITFVYPGASASSVEQDVTSVVEDTLRSVTGVTERQTISYDNVCIAILTFKYGTDIDAKKKEAEELFATVNLPEECQAPVFTAVNLNGAATATVALYGNDDMQALMDDVNILQRSFLGIEGVGSVKLIGAPVKQINIKAVDGMELASLLLMQALSAENSDIPLGTITAGNSIISIRNASDATSIIDIMNLPVKLELNSSVVTELSALQSAVHGYATCTWQEFLDYKQASLDARKQMIDMEGMTSAELQEQRDGLGAMKGIMELLRSRTSGELKVIWVSTIAPVIPTLKDMTDEELQDIANNNEGISYELLVWARDGARDGTLESNWHKLEDFRAIVPQEDINGDGKVNGDDITYQQFAQLFRQGGSINVDGEEKTFEGLNMVHDTTCEIPECDKEHMTEEETADACKFAEQVNLAGYDDIIESAKQAEADNKPLSITDQQFATLFSTVTADEQNLILMSDKVIHIIRADNFETEVLPALEKYKKSHTVTDESSPDYGKAVYLNGEVYRENEDGQPINKDGYLIGKDGRLVDSNGNYIDAQGNKISLTDEQKLTYPYTLGEYCIMSDEEYLSLYTEMNVDMDMGISLSAETIHLLRIINFDKTTTSGDTSTILLTVASLGKVSEEIVYSDFAQYNGERAIVIEVYANSEANTTDIVNTVKSKLAEGGFDGQAILLSDTAQFITDSISNVLSSIIIGGILAVLIIYLFVRKIGSSLVVSITMPLSVLVALLCMWAMGITLNVVSLGGLAVGIGMLVDNSIVVLESITKYRDKGVNVYQSCINGTAEVGGSLVASTLTNICVFFPILFTQGLTREIFFDLVWAVIFSLVMSLIVAVTVIPTLYYLIYHRNESPANSNMVLKVAEGVEPHAGNGNNANSVVNDTNLTVNAVNVNASDNSQLSSLDKKQQRALKRRQRRQAQEEKARHRISRTENIYGGVLKKVLRKRMLVCLLALVIFAGSTVMVFITGMDFMPSVDKGEIEVGIKFDASTSLEDAESATLELKDAINSLYSNNELQQIAVTIGVQGLMATDISGKLLVKIDTNKIETGTVAQDIRKLSQEMGITGVSVTELDGIVATVTSGMAGMSVSIVGDDLDTLSEICGKVETSLKNVEGIVSVRNNASQRIKQYSFVIDKYLCAEKNVEYMAVVGLLRIALSKDVVATLNIGGDETNVYVGVNTDYISDINSILDLTVGLGSDGAVKVRDVLRTNSQGEIFAPDGGIIESQVMTQFNKIDGRYVATLDVESYGVDTGTVSKRINSAVNAILADYQGYEYQESGVTSYLNEAFSGLVVALICAFLLLYGVMACQFESLVKPLVVIASIPFSFTGGFLALVITGTSLSVVSFVGIIMLMGVIVNGAIVMIDKIDMLIKEGMTPQQAVIEGCKSRLRPILMTTLTTVLALVPLALGLGDGGELMQPMGIVVLGGLLLGTIVTLVLIPCFYCIVKRIRFNKDDMTGGVAALETDAVIAINNVSNNNEQSSAKDTESQQNNQVESGNNTPTNVKQDTNSNVQDNASAVSDGGVNNIKVNREAKLWDKTTTATKRSSKTKSSAKISILTDEVSQLEQASANQKSLTGSCSEQANPDADQVEQNNEKDKKD